MQTNHWPPPPHLVCLDKIFKGIKPPYGAMYPGQVVAAVRTRRHPNLHATILMACVAEQTKFLTVLWSEMYPIMDDDMQTAWKALSQAGFVDQLLDTKDRRAQDLFTATYTGVMVSRGKL